MKAPYRKHNPESDLLERYNIWQWRDMETDEAGNDEFWTTQTRLYWCISVLATLCGIGIVLMVVGLS